jgi:23S rRNA pseudouridine2605 synthase
VEKTYHARVRGIPSAAALARLREGIEIEGRRTAPAGVRLLEADRPANQATVELRLHEGRKRQARLMLAAVGHRVLALRRVQLGPLTLGRLQPGEWRFLTPEEVARLRNAAAPELTENQDGAPPPARKAEQ